ncbi:Ig-like domain-containing protein [Escherichia coli]
MTTHPVNVDLSAVAVSINTITADDVINAAEKGAALTLSGSTTGVEAGQTVTVISGGKTYTASVAANGSWSTAVPAADMAALRDVMPVHRPASAMSTATAPPLPTLTASMPARQR